MTMLKNLKKTGKYLGQTIRLMVGIPDYDVYLQHMRAAHPENPPMTYEAFFKERQNARYGAGGTRCC